MKFIYAKNRTKNKILWAINQEMRYLMPCTDIYRSKMDVPVLLPCNVICRNKTYISEWNSRSQIYLTKGICQITLLGETGNEIVTFPV